jgi:hypothetical protein
MKQILLTIFIAATLLSSCSKEKSVAEDTNYHLTCSIDGVPTRFNVNSGAIELNQGGFWVLGMGGISADSANAPTLALGIYATETGKKVPAGSYTDNGTTFQLLSTYSDVQQQIDYSAGQDMYNQANQAGFTIQNHLQIQVIELTDKIVRGTFSGDYFEDSELDGTIKKITNGDYYLLIQQ